MLTKNYLCIPFTGMPSLTGFVPRLVHLTPNRFARKWLNAVFSSRRFVLSIDTERLHSNLWLVVHFEPPLSKFSSRRFVQAIWYTEQLLSSLSALGSFRESLMYDLSGRTDIYHSYILSDLMVS